MSDRYLVFDGTKVESTFGEETTYYAGTASVRWSDGSRVVHGGLRKTTTFVEDFCLDGHTDRGCDFAIWVEDALGYAFGFEAGGREDVGGEVLNLLEGELVTVREDGEVGVVTDRYGTVVHVPPAEYGPWRYAILTVDWGDGTRCHQVAAAADWPSYPAEGDRVTFDGEGRDFVVPSRS